MLLLLLLLVVVVVVAVWKERFLYSMSGAGLDSCAVVVPASCVLMMTLVFAAVMVWGEAWRVRTRRDFNVKSYITPTRTSAAEKGSDKGHTRSTHADLLAWT